MLQLNDIANIYAFPLVNTQPAGTENNPANPIQHWQVHPSQVGPYSYAFLDRQTAELKFATIPADQANQANIPIGGQPSITINQNPAINEPPIDLGKYNGLAAQGLHVVATPFGLTIEPINPPAPAAPADNTGVLDRIDANVQELMANVQTILTKLP